MTLQFADDLTAMPPPWSDFAANHEAEPFWLSEVDDRYVGCFAVSIDTLAGLRPWDDALEGAAPGPWVLFEVEKLVRMALRQSGLAFEALTSAVCWGTFPARDIARAAVTKQLLRYYRDVARPLRDGATDSNRWRALLTGAALAKHGIVSRDITTLRSLLDAPADPEPAVVVELLDALESSNLPSRPTDYDYLNDVVVSYRTRSR